MSDTRSAQYASHIPNLRADFTPGNRAIRQSGNQAIRQSGNQAIRQLWAAFGLCQPSDSLNSHFFYIFPSFCIYPIGPLRHRGQPEYYAKYLYFLKTKSADMLFFAWFTDKTEEK
jgi:hypothetical protein